jgi:hypothetical protein
MTEDQSEVAFILYMGIVQTLVVCGSLLLWLCKKRPLKLFGLAVLLIGIAAAIQFDTALQLAYERGLFAYLP